MCYKDRAALYGSISYFQTTISIAVSCKNDSQNNAASVLDQKADVQSHANYLMHAKCLRVDSRLPISCKLIKCELIGGKRALDITWSIYEFLNSGSKQRQVQSLQLQEHKKSK